MPKLEGRADTRPKLTELTTDIVIDCHRLILHKWERPGPCSVADCGVRPDWNDRYAVAARETEIDAAAAGQLDYRRIRWFILCDFHARFLEALHQHEEPPSE